MKTHFLHSSRKIFQPKLQNQRITAQLGSDYATKITSHSHLQQTDRHPLQLNFKQNKHKTESNKSDDEAPLALTCAETRMDAVGGVYRSGRKSTCRGFSSPSVSPGRERCVGGGRGTSGNRRPKNETGGEKTPKVLVIAGRCAMEARRRRRKRPKLRTESRRVSRWTGEACGARWRVKLLLESQGDTGCRGVSPSQ